MIKRSTLIATAFLATTAIVGLASFPGCGSEETPAQTTNTAAGRRPTGRPSATKAGTTKWFAVNALKLGVSRKSDGVTDPNAWKDYGWNMDGVITSKDDSKTSAGTCKRIEGSSTGILADGNEGIDNNFGQHVMSTIKALRGSAEDDVNDAISDGSFTLLMKLDNYTTDDNSDVKGTVYVANDFADDASDPTFTAGETGWRILKDSKDNPLTFNGYVANGYWYSGDFGQGEIKLSISLSGADITLPIASGLISFKLADGSDGTIAGAMNIDALKEALTPVAKRFNICPGNATYEQVVTSLTQSADLVSGAPNLQDTSKTCNAISIALGFTVKEVGDHSNAPIKTPAPDPGTDECVEGGETDAAPTDAASDAATD